MTERAHELSDACWSVLRALGQARAWALFAVGDRGARLLASDRIDRCCLDDVSVLADEHAVPIPATPARHSSDDTARARLVVVFPGFISPQDHGLLYLEVPPRHVQLALLLHLQPHDLDAVLRTRLGTLPSPLSPAPLDAVAAEANALKALLARHEWNVARVARLLGVTRMTVYNRMRRHGIARVRIARVPRRRRPGREDP